MSSQIDLLDEIIVDGFCGGGGVSLVEGIT